MIVKADLDGDMRRINITLPEDAPSTEVLKTIRTGVAQAFDMEESLLQVLKYRDEEGDLCSLVAASVEDMLDLNNKGTLRLFASQSTTAPVVSSSTQDIEPLSAPPLPPPSEQPPADSVICQEETTEDAIATLMAMGFSEE